MSGARRGVTRLNGARGVIAQRMVQSLANAAQLTFCADCDVSGLLARRAAWAAAGRRVAFEDCLIAALADALAARPEANGVIVGDDLHWSDEVNVAVAMPIGGALLTPVVRCANRVTLDEIAALRLRLTQDAANGTLKASAFSGASVTLSNLGRGVVRHFTPILNTGQAALLGAGSVCAQPVVDASGAVVVARVLGLSLTVDHRFIDGEPASRLLGEICAMLSGLRDER